MFNFEKLDVWQKSIDFVYFMTQSFPDAERFELTNQMRRAAVSISSNIAEGSSRASRVDFARFVELAHWLHLRSRFTGYDLQGQHFLSEENYSHLSKARAKNNARC